MGEPDDLLGEDALAVDDSGDLAVGAAGVEAYAAAAEVAADGLRIGLFRRQGVAEDDLEGPLVDAGHEIRVEGAAALGRVGGADALKDTHVAAYIDLPAAEEPEHGLDHAVGVVYISLSKIGRAVDEGVHDGDLAAGTLHGYAEGLLRALEEGGVELVQRDVVPVELGDVFDVDFYSKVFHGGHPPQKCSLRSF